MQDLTTGSVVRHLLKTTSFMLVTMLFQTLYFIVDLYWVGHLGREAVAAVGLSGNLMFIVLAISQMLGVGTTTLISHAAGRKDHAAAQGTFKQAQILSVLVGGLFFVSAWLLRGAYTRALSADETTARLAGEYLVWFLPALGLQFGIVAMGAALRGTGNFKPGMVVQTATVIINIVFAPVLMFGWISGHPMGVAGTALATFISVVIGTVWLMTYFIPAGAYLRFSPGGWRPQLDLWKRLLGIGLPAGAEFLLMAVYLFLIYSISRPFGSAAQAGFGIGMRVVQAGFMPVVALGFGVAPVAGQNFGARLPTRVRDVFRSAVLMAVVAMLILTVICNIAPAALVGVFSQDRDVIAVGSEYLRIVSWNFVASGIVFVCASMFQAMGNTIPSLVTSFVRLFIVAIPVLLMSRMAGFELRWVWYLTVASVTLQMLLNLLLLRREFRLKLGVPSETVAAVPA